MSPDFRVMTPLSRSPEAPRRRAATKLYRQSRSLLFEAQEGEVLGAAQWTRIDPSCAGHVGSPDGGRDSADVCRPIRTVGRARGAVDERPGPEETAQSTAGIGRIFDGDQRTPGEGSAVLE